MDRQQAAVHYISQAELALKNVLDLCLTTYGQDAADKLAKMFTDNLFGQNLPSYCDYGEVLSLWGVISRLLISERSYGGEFIIALSQQFHMFVDPAVPASVNEVESMNNLSPLGAHLVGAICRNHPAIALPETAFHEELAAYNLFMQDVPRPIQVLKILTYFPWMAPLYLLSFSDPNTLTTLLQSYIKKAAAMGVAGNPA